MCNGKTKFQHTASGKKNFQKDLPPIVILLKSHPPNLAITYEFLTISRINYLHARTKKQFSCKDLLLFFFSLHKLRMYEKVRNTDSFLFNFAWTLPCMNLALTRLLKATSNHKTTKCNSKYTDVSGMVFQDLVHVVGVRFFKCYCNVLSK